LTLRLGQTVSSKTRKLYKRSFAHDDEIVAAQLEYRGVSDVVRHPDVAEGNAIARGP
jgi:hypothetical protein